MEYNIYRLSNGKKPKSWQLPLKETFIKKFAETQNVKKDLGYRRIQYVPGSDSFYAEDHKGDYTPQQIWFEYGELRVRKDDALLNSILQEHPWYGKRYKLWSQEIEDQEKLDTLKAKSEATRLIDESDASEIKAIALAVFGHEAGIWTEPKCELRLREKAAEDPKGLKNTFNETDYSSRLLAGQAFVKGIVEENKTKNAVVWCDSDGVIIKLAKGEKGINELGRFLSVKTEESSKVIQSIGERIQALDTGVNLVATKTTTKEGDSTIESIREEYAAKVGDVPPNMKNNKEWLLNKIKEANS